MVMQVRDYSTALPFQCRMLYEADIEELSVRKGSYLHLLNHSYVMTGHPQPNKCRLVHHQQG